MGARELQTRSPDRVASVRTRAPRWHHKAPGPDRTGRTAARALTWGGRSSRDTPPAAWRGTRPEPRRRARSGSRTGPRPAGTAVPARGQFEVKRAEGRFPLPAPDRLCQSRTRGGHAPEVRALRGVRAQGGRNLRGAWPSTGCVCVVGARRRSGRGEGLGRTSPTSVPACGLSISSQGSFTRSPPRLSPSCSEVRQSGALLQVSVTGQAIRL